MTSLNLTSLKELAEKADKISHGQTVAHCDSREWADFIAAADPATILALLDKIESLQHTLAICRDKNSQLEEEADWLSGQLVACTEDIDADLCPYKCDLCGRICTAEGWRKAARKAVEASDEHDDA